MVKVTLRGKKISLNPDDVKKLKINSISSKSLKSEYYVVVNGKEIPIKVALFELLKKKGINLTLLDFTTQDAVRIFRKSP
jgi:hypothetical protein